MIGAKKMNLLVGRVIHAGIYGHQKAIDTTEFNYSQKPHPRCLKVKPVCHNQVGHKVIGFNRSCGWHSKV